MKSKSTQSAAFARLPGILILSAVLCGSKLIAAGNPSNSGADGIPHGLEQVLLGYKWSWADEKSDGPPAVVQFFPNGRVSGGWHWRWLRKPSGEVIVDCFWGEDSHMFLSFNPDLTEFGAYGGSVAKGKRLESIPQASLVSQVAVFSQGGPRPPAANPPATAPANPPPAIAPQVPPAPQQAAGPPPASGQAMIQVLSDQAPNVANWITAPLNRDVPPEIYQNITFLKEALRDEAVRGAVASPQAYAEAVRLCYTLAADLEDRRQAEVLSGGDAVLHQHSNLTEWRRDHLTWPMYALEQDERAERHENAKKTKVFLSDLKKQEWANHSRDMRTVIDAQYSLFREALRKSPPARK